MPNHELCVGLGGGGVRLAVVTLWRYNFLQTIDTACARQYALLVGNKD